MAKSKHVTITNHSTRIRTLHYMEGESQRKCTLMPGDTTIDKSVWEECMENKVAKALTVPGSLRDRTGRVIPDRAVLSRKVAPSRAPKPEPDPEVDTQDPVGDRNPEATSGM